MSELTLLKCVCGASFAARGLPAAVAETWRAQHAGCGGVAPASCATCDDYVVCPREEARMGIGCADYEQLVAQEKEGEG